MTRSQVTEISLAKMLLCVVLVFCVCNIPAIIRAILFSVSDNSDLIRLSDAGRLEVYFPYTILRIFDWLGIAINSAVNFFIYCLMSRTFRKALAELCSQRVSLLRKSLQTNDRAETLDSVATRCSNTRSTSICTVLSLAN